MSRAPMHDVRAWVRDDDASETYERPLELGFGIGVQQRGWLVLHELLFALPKS